MAQFTGSGTCIAVSAASPATHDSTGFAALTYTQVGEPESLGAIETRHAAVTFANLCSGKTSQAKGAEEAINFDISVAMDRDDAGQAILTTARASLSAKVSIRVTENSGDVAYLVGYVMGERVAGGAGVNDVRMNVYNIGVVTPASSGAQTVVVVKAP